MDISKFTSRDEIVKLIKPGGVGVELGVAEGKFSEKLLRDSQLKHLYSIDMWAGDRGHDDAQYEVACKRLTGFGERNTVLRMRFDEALPRFENDFFDFIYIDGYAHTGQDEGQTLHEWFPKLRAGGIFAGDDYSEKYPKTIEQVDRFAALQGLQLHIIKDWNGHHSWVVFKG